MAWWFAVLVIIGAGKLIYDAVTDDDTSSSSSSSDRDDREREAKKRAKEEKNERIHEEINEYKENQSSQIEEKYGAIISFEGRTEYEDINKASKIQIMYQDKTREYEIDDLKKERMELEESIKELEAIKNETFK